MLSSDLSGKSHESHSPEGSSVYRKINMTSGIFLGIKREGVVIYSIALENSVANTIRTAHYGKVGCYTVEYTTALLCSDWLYPSVLWLGINL